MKPLDLYAKIEPFIGFYDEYEELYAHYLQLIQPLHVKTILDIGCGNGKLLKLLDESNFQTYGIDRSVQMLANARKLGVNVGREELSDFKENSFDCALAVADVLNYMNSDELLYFFKELARVIKKDGYFLADVNTIIGFELADGVMVRDEKDSFLAVESFYENEQLSTNITLFEKEKENYKKFHGKILQYYHQQSIFENIKNLKLMSIQPINMFGDGIEKSLMLFRKV